MNLKDTLATTGNSHHIGSFLAHFESNIEKNEISKNSISDSPNYYAWLCIASERVLYRIRELIYFNEGDSEAFENGYAKLVNRLFSNYSLSSPEKESIILFLKIRHLVVHKGFPNPLEAPANRENNSIANGIDFTKQDVWDLVHKLRVPSSFPELKNDYRLAMKSISHLEKPVEQDFGNVTIRKEKSS
ncbi:hypothetical protein P4E94_19700 [Pontiellaceae bacterium B12219]|nr:hypothetical protein [Pontiellaceae bacterium B12219]